MSIANKIVVGLVGLTVMAVVFSAMLPIMGEVTSAENTFTNEGLWKMKPFEEGDVWVMSEAGVWSYNSEPAITTDNSASSVMIGDDWTVRGTGAIYGHTVYNASPSTVTITVGETSTSINSGSVNSVEGYGVVANGDYIVTKYDKPVYVHGDSPIWATGYSGFDGVGCVIHIEGNIDDGVTVECSTINNTSALSNFAVTDVVIHSTKDNVYDDLYLLEGITFTVTCDYTTGGVTTEKTGNISYSSYVVPSEVTAEKTYHPDGPTTAILNMLPVIICAGLLLGAIAFMIVTRK